MAPPPASAVAPARRHAGATSPARRRGRGAGTAAPTPETRRPPLRVIPGRLRPGGRRAGVRPGPQTRTRTRPLAGRGRLLNIVAVCLDHYAGVGWIGTFVPWHSHYRPTAVGVGSIAMYGIVLVAGTAALAGSIARRIWLPVHSLSAAIFGLCLAHGLLAGSDSHVLWGMYAVTGTAVAALQVTRVLARPPALADARS